MKNEEYNLISGQKYILESDYGVLMLVQETAQTGSKDSQVAKITQVCLTTTCGKCKVNCNIYLKIGR